MAKWGIALFGFYRSTCEIRENAWTPVKRILAYGYHLEPHYADADSWVGEGKGYGNSGYAKLTKDINKAAGLPQQLTVARCVMTPELKSGAFVLPLFENKDGNYFATKAVNFLKAENDGQSLIWDASKHHIHTYDPVWLSTKVCIPGDIVAYCPYRDDRPMWTPLEQKHFLTMVIDGLENSNMPALKEPFWDLSSYKPTDTEKLKDTVFMYPRTFIKKRRFHLTLSDLDSMGVDLEQMLTKELEYVAKTPVIDRTVSFDKLRGRKTLGSDGLNIMPMLEVKPSVRVDRGVL